MKEKVLLKNTFIVSFGKICTQLITFLLLPLYTSYLSTSEFGIVDLLNTLVGLFLPILTLQLDQGVFRFLIDNRKNEIKQQKLISTTILIISLQIIVFIFIYILFGRYYKNEYKFYLVINIISNIYSNLFLQISRGIGNNTCYAIGSFLSGSVTVIMNVLLITHLKMGALGMLLGTFIGNVTCLFYTFLKSKIYKYIKFSFFNKNLARELLKYSIPLIPNMISWWIVNVSDRSIITIFLGVAMNGIYSAANKFSVVITTLYSVFNLTWTESASLTITSEDANEFFSKILNFIITFFGCICLCVIAFMPFIFPVLINEKFNEAYWQIPILILGVVFNILVSFLGSIYIAKKLTNEIAKTSIISASINIVINVLLIQKIGLFAASLSTFISYFIMFIYRLYDSKKYIKLSFDEFKLHTIIFSYILAIITYYIDSFCLSIAIAIYVVFISIILNISNLNMILNLVRKKL